jgi:hypothetical protein
MRCADINLGTVQVASKAHYLRLQVQSTAQFAPSAEDDIDQLRRKLTAHELNHNRRLPQWILRGNEFGFVLSLMLPDALQEHTKCTLIDTLSEQLRNTEVFCSHMLYEAMNY